MHSIPSAIACSHSRISRAIPRFYASSRRYVAAPAKQLYPAFQSSVVLPSCKWRRRRAMCVNAQAIATAVMPETTVRVCFKLPYRCHFGQNVYLVGAGEELGNWRVEDSKRMKWSDGDIWVVEVEVGAGRKPHQLEYKYVVLNPDGGVSAWKPGNNCSVEVSDQPEKINVFDAWDGAIHDVQVMLSRPTPQDFDKLAAVAAATAPINKLLPMDLDDSQVDGPDAYSNTNLYEEEDVLPGTGSDGLVLDEQPEIVTKSSDEEELRFGIGELGIPNPLAKFEPTGSALEDFPITTRWLFTPPQVEPPAAKNTSTSSATSAPSSSNVTSFPIDPVEEIEGYAESIANYTSPLSSSATWRTTNNSTTSSTTSSTSSSSNPGSRSGSGSDTRMRSNRFGSLDKDDGSAESDAGGAAGSQQPVMADIGGLPSKPIPPPVFAASGSEESPTLSQLAMVLSERNAVESAMKRALQEIDLHLQESLDLGGKLSDPAHETRLEMDRKLAAANMRVNAYTKVLNACPPVKELQAAIELERKESQM